MSTTKESRDHADLVATILEWVDSTNEYAKGPFYALARINEEGYELLCTVKELGAAWAEVGAVINDR